MSNHIIDPAVFYWMNVLSIVQTVCAVFGAIILIGGISLVIYYIYQMQGLSKPEKPGEPSKNYSEYEYDRDVKRYEEHMRSYERDLLKIKQTSNWAVITMVIGLVMVLMAIFIPSKQTSIEMLVARTATFDNVDWTVAQVKEIIDYIVSALKGVV